MVIRRLALTLCLFGLPALAAAVPLRMNYQGRLTDSSGVPAATGSTHTVQVLLYDALTGGSVVWNETHTNVSVTAGLFNLVLGSVSPIALAFDQPYFLTVNVNGNGEMSPRTPLTTAPYSFRAAYADSASVTAPLSLTGPSSASTISAFNGNNGAGGWFQGLTGVVARGSELGIYALNTTGGGFKPAILGEAGGTGVGVVGRGTLNGAVGALGGSLQNYGGTFVNGVGVQGLGQGGSGWGVFGEGDNGVYGKVTRGAGTAVKAESTLPAALALQVLGNATFDGAGNTTTFNSYVSFTAGTNLAAAGGATAPLSLTSPSTATALSAFNPNGGIGILGRSSLAGGAGVFADATVAGAKALVAQGLDLGVSATASGSNATGVMARVDSVNFAVFGWNDSASSTGGGVIGQSANGFGLYGTANGANGVGVYGTGGRVGVSATASTGSGTGGWFSGVTGVIAVTDQSAGNALSAFNNYTGGAGTATAIEALSTGNSGIGVLARAPQGAGASKGVVAEGGFIGVSAVGGVGSGAGVYAGGYTALDADGAINVRGKAAGAVSAAGQGRIYFDSAANKFKVSENGGTYADLLPGTGTYVLKSGDSMSGSLSLPANGLSVGASQLFTTASGIGMGIATPLSALDLRFNTAGVDGLRIQGNNAASTPALRLYDSAGTPRASFGFSNSSLLSTLDGANQLVLSTNNTERARFDAGGNLGLGVTAPNSLLDMNGVLTMRALGVPSLSSFGQGSIYFDSATNKFKVSENNGAYKDLLGSPSAPVSVTSIAGTTAPFYGYNSSNGNAMVLSSNAGVGGVLNVRNGSAGSQSYGILSTHNGTATDRVAVVGSSDGFFSNPVGPTGIYGYSQNGTGVMANGGSVGLSATSSAASGRAVIATNNSNKATGQFSNKGSGQALEAASNGGSTIYAVNQATGYVLELYNGFDKNVIYAEGGGGTSTTGATIRAQNTSGGEVFSGSSSGIVANFSAFGSQPAVYANNAGSGVGVYAYGRPALDADGPVDLHGLGSPGSSSAGRGRIYFDSASNKFKVSENGGAFVDLVSGAITAPLSLSGSSAAIPAFHGNNSFGGPAAVFTQSGGGTAVSITATAPGKALHVNWNGNQQGVYVQNTDASITGYGIYTRVNGVAGSAALYGWNQGNGDAVYGIANGTGAGVMGEANGNGPGVRGYSGNAGPAVLAEATGGNTALSATASNVLGRAIYARSNSGSRPTAEFINDGIGSPIKLNALSFPASAGSNGQVLTTDGSATMNWANVPSPSAPFVINAASNNPQSVIQGNNTGSSGSGIRGETSSTSLSYGVVGNSTSNYVDSAGVAGFSGNPGIPNGLYGGNGIGVIGANGASGVGVYGLAKNGGGIGMVAQGNVLGLSATASISSGIAVYGRASNNNTGVGAITGINDYSSSSAAGVVGMAPSGIGVVGSANSAPIYPGGSAGVFAFANGSAPVALYASNPNGSGAVIAGASMGLSTTANSGPAVFARTSFGGAAAQVINDNNSGIGVLGAGNGNGVGVQGQIVSGAAGSIGVYGTNSVSGGIGVFGENTVVGGYGVQAQNTAANATSGAALFVNGNIKVGYNSTSVAPSTTLTPTLNKPSGRIGFTSGGAIQTITVANNFVSANSHVIVTLNIANAITTAPVVQIGVGSIVIKLAAPVSVSTSDSINILVINM